MASAWCISGTISARPPKDTAAAISTAIRPMLRSIFSCALAGAAPCALFWVMSRFSGACVGGVGDEDALRRDVAGGGERLPGVQRHQAHAGEHHHAAAEADEVVGVGGLQCLD